MYIYAYSPSSLSPTLRTKRGDKLQDNLRMSGAQNRGMVRTWTCTKCAIKGLEKTNDVNMCELPYKDVGTYCCRCTAKLNPSLDFDRIGCRHCKARNSYEEGKRDAGWEDLRLAALCIGVGAYPGPSRLDNPVRDADALFDAINKLPDCRAAIVRDPPDKNAILVHLQNFLGELAALSANQLPDVVMLVVASHGMQHESNVFIIPAQAKCDSKLNLERTCVSHLRVLEYLNECLDIKARRCAMSQNQELKFLLIMDMYRVPGEFEFPLTQTISEPKQKNAPRCWSICYSTSRGSVAADGARGSHSPLVLGLLDPESGIFAPGVSLKEGIEHACNVVETQSGVGPGQSPTVVGQRAHLSAASAAQTLVGSEDDDEEEFVV